MSDVRHVFVLRRPFVRFMVTGGDIISSGKAGERSASDTKLMKSRLLKITRYNTGSVEDGNKVPQKGNGERGQKLLSSNSLSTLPCFLEWLMDSGRVQMESSYSIFTFEPLRSLPP